MKMRIHRPIEKAYHNRKYRILYNQEFQCGVGPGETVEIELPDHGELEFKIDLITGSPAIRLINGSPVELSVSGNFILSQSPVVIALLSIGLAVSSLLYQGSIISMLLMGIIGFYLLMITLFRKRWLKVRVHSGKRDEKV